MKNIEKYIILLIILAAISFSLPFIRDIYLAQQYGTSPVPLIDKAEWKSYIAIMDVVQNIAAAMWLIYLAKAQELNRTLWGIFGLVFGLIGVGLFYLASIHENQKT